MRRMILGHIVFGNGRILLVRMQVMVETRRWNGKRVSLRTVANLLHSRAYVRNILEKRNAIENKNDQTKCIRVVNDRSSRKRAAPQFFLNRARVAAT